MSDPVISCTLHRQPDLSAHACIHKHLPDRSGWFMQAAAVDPGGSYTSIYRQSRIFSRGPLNWIMRVLIISFDSGTYCIVQMLSKSADW